MWEIEANLDNYTFELTKGSAKVVVPFQDLELEGFESSQEHEDPVGDLSEPESLTLVFEGENYQIPAYSDLEDNTSFFILEWYSPT